MRNRSVSSEGAGQEGEEDGASQGKVSRAGGIPPSPTASDLPANRRIRTKVDEDQEEVEEKDGRPQTSLEKGGESLMERNNIRRVEREAQSRICDKVREIVNREFSTSLRDKEHEVETIDQRLLQIQKALHLVRYGAVSSYYAGTMVKQCSSQPENVSVHPAVRLLLHGKRPAESDCSFSSSSNFSSPTKVARNDMSFIKEEEVEEAEEQAVEITPQVMPGYVPPRPSDRELAVSDPRGLHHKVKRRLIIGNVSKWIQCDQREDLATHKWMIYVRGDQTQPDVSDVVSRVRFLIHPSYSPHDLVEVSSAPFHLTRRGWGEFPARVQVHFKHERDKPIDVIHHLKLDRTYTGLQTLGAETVVDVWLHNQEGTAAQAAGPGAQSKALIDQMEDTPEGWVIPHTSESCDLLPEPFLATLQDPLLEELGVDRGEKSKPAIALTPKVELPDPPKTEDERQTTYIRCTDKDGDPYYLPVTILPNNHQRQVGGLLGQPVGRPLRKPPVLATRTRNGKLDRGIRLIKGGEAKMEIEMASNNDNLSVLKKPTVQHLSTLHQQQSVLQRKPFVVDHAAARSSSSSPRVSMGSTSTPVMNGGSSLLRSRSLMLPGTSLLKRNLPAVAPPVNNLMQPSPQQQLVTELERVVPNVALSLWSRILGRNPEDTEADIENRVAKRGLNYLKKHADHYLFFSEKLFHLKASDFQNEDKCILYIARYLPLVTPQANDPLYRSLHPYAAASIKSFQSWNVGKQLSAEWHRSKTIHRLIANIENLKSFIRSTKYIVKLLREHGFSLPLQVPRSPSETTLPLPSLLVTVPSLLSSLEEFIPESSQIDQALLKSRHRSGSATTVDIITLEDSSSGSSSFKAKAIKLEPQEVKTPDRACLLLPEDNVHALKFVSETSGLIGVKFGMEEVAPGVFYQAAEKVMYRACKNMCETLIRKGHQSAWKRTGGPPTEISATDILLAIQNDPDLTLFTNFGMGRAIKQEHSS